MTTQLNILAIDTAYAGCSVALQCGDAYFVEHAATERKHNELILPMIESVLQKANCDLTALSAIAFGCGPGSFTGVRIAASVTQGLAYVSKAPVIRVSSLQAIAQKQYQISGAKRILVAIDARMQAVYWASFIEQHGIMMADDHEQQADIEKFQAPDGEWMAIGDAWQAYPQLSRCAHWEWGAADWQTQAIDLLPMANLLYRQQQFVKPEQAIPTYLSESHWRKLPGRQ